MINALKNIINNNNHYYFDKIINDIYKKLYFNKDRIFYVCSYGGCGSYMLCNYLSYFGKVYHIHSRNTPKNLEYIGEENSNKYIYSEWFNHVEIEKNKLYKYQVIYIYKNHGLFEFQPPIILSFNHELLFIMRTLISNYS